MMSIQRISLILPTEYLEDCERCLRAAGVPGMTIDSVRGLGGHANYFSSDLLRSNVRIEMYVGAERCKELCETIRDFALGLPVKGGILVVETVDRMITLENGLELTAEML